MYLEAIQTLHRTMWQWLKDQIAQEVPEAVALCEYDCRKQQCTGEEWATCERRTHQAAGELWPESSPRLAAKQILERTLSEYPPEANSITT